MKPTASASFFWLLILILLPLRLPAQGAEVEPTPIATEPLDEAAAATDAFASLERQAEKRFEEDDLEGAIRIYRQIADQQTDTDEKMRLLVTVAWIQSLLGRPSDAQATLTGALALAPDYPFQADLYDGEFRKLFYEAQIQAIELRRGKAEDDIRSGIEAMQRRDLATARDYLRRALSILPDHPQGLYILALVDLLDRRSDEAFDGFQKVLALQAARPDAIKPQLHARALNNLGLLYLQKEQPQEALTVLQQAVEVDAENQSAWTNLGAAQRQLGNRSLAAEAFQRAYRLAPENGEAINNLAVAYIDAENWVAAVGLLVEATRRIDDDPQLWLNLGEAQLGLGNGDGAIGSLEAAIRHDPDDRRGIASAAALRLAVNAYRAERPAEVLRHAAQALRFRPELAEAWIYQGLAQQQLDDLASAQKSFEEAKRLDPTRADVYNNLGGVYFDLGRLEEAQAAFERALVLDPELANARENLEAIRQVQRGERSGPTRGASPPVSSSPPPTAPPPVARPRIGWRFADIDYSALGLTGVMIESVSAQSPAGKAGLQANDLILKVDGQDVTDATDLEEQVYTRRQVVLDLLRANVPTRVQLSLE